MNYLKTLTRDQKLLTAATILIISAQLVGLYYTYFLAFVMVSVGAFLVTLTIRPSKTRSGLASIDAYLIMYLFSYLFTFFVAFIIGSQLVVLEEHVNVKTHSVKYIGEETIVLDNFEVLTDKALYFECLHKKCIEVDKTITQSKALPFYNSIFDRTAEITYTIKGNK